MKRVQKGTPGFLDYKRKVEILRTIIYFGIVLLIFLLGYSQTHTRLNMLTVVAVLGCLPASKALVGVISRFPYHSVKEKLVKEVKAVTTHLTVGYDMIITSREKIMPIDCIVISGHTVFGYTHYSKVNVQEASRYIRSILVENQFSNANVKILNQYKAFLARAEGLNNIAAVEKKDTKETEARILHTILNISM
ncbi:hypothetical protein OCV51_03140 [Faecalicatena acetigenes]|uniref:NERD domain-containing protein n=1 Tax=Faecalicatena acetigenes TaxID=2981790 RepID=A0ABT2T9K9_9FIRM|nr:MULTISPECIES: hypothetical protein [Lachnospiraceae]MCU6746661.1 hypothetical protein [Faecalicatena acetigenes]SCH34885.1 Uncharacterised protein [uncultured Clostridium sp.]